MTAPLQAIGFDADDTLWHNENLFEEIHARYCELLACYHDADTVERTLYATEMRNLPLYGYGVKGFTLSAIETAITLTAGKIGSEEINRLLQLGRDLLAHPVELIDGAPEVIAALAAQNLPLILITKGDLLHQERKIALSGLSPHFHHTEVVSEKNPSTYAALLRRLGLTPATFLMVGNSLKSDIAPLLELGGHAAHIPYAITWQHEHLDQLPEAPGRFHPLNTLRDVPPLVQRLLTAS